MVYFCHFNEPELWFEPMQQHILIFIRSLFLISYYYFFC